MQQDWEMKFGRRQKINNNSVRRYKNRKGQKERVLCAHRHWLWRDTL